MYRILVGLLVSAPALARAVYLNGVDITSIRGQSIDQANITLSANGDIWIHAPQYDIIDQTTQAPLSRPAPAEAPMPTSTPPPTPPEAVAPSPTSTGTTPPPASPGTASP